MEIEHIGDNKIRCALTEQEIESLGYDIDEIIANSAGIHAYCLRTRRGTGTYSDGGHLSDGEGGAFAGS